MKKLFVFFTLFMLLPFNVKAEVVDTNPFQDFFTAYQNSELGQQYIDQIIFDGDQIIVELEGVPQSNYFYFTYDNQSKVLSYEPSTVLRNISQSNIMSNISQITMEKKFVENAILVLCDLKNCDANKVFQVIAEDTDLTLSENGIEYEYVKTGLASDYYSALELDIENGITIATTEDANNGNSSNESGNTGSESDNTSSGNENVDSDSTGNESGNTGSGNANVDNDNTGDESGNTGSGNANVDNDNTGDESGNTSSENENANNDNTGDESGNTDSEDENADNNDTENTQLWNDFIDAYVNNYKNNEVMKIILADNVIETTSTSDSLNVVVNGDNANSFSFTYKDGILTYVPSQLVYLDLTDEEVLKENHDKFSVEGILVMNCLLALADIKGYEDDFFTSMEDNINYYTLEENGVYYREFNYSYTDTDENGTITSSGDIVKAFQLDVKNGINMTNIDGDDSSLEYTPEEDCDPEETPSTPKEETVKNPETGLFNNYGVVIGSVIALGAIGYFVIRKRSKFPQA